MTDSNANDPLLSVRDLEKYYPVRSGLLRRRTGWVRAVDGVSFELDTGEALGLVGESGCGKSTAAATLVGLEDPTGGEIRFDGTRLRDHDRAQRKGFRRRAQMVFQDPTTAFDPRMTVGQSVAEPLRIHDVSGQEAREIVEDTLERVGMAATDADSYPEAFSGGEKQRIALARALVLDPDLLVLDEPVSALDASVQAEVLALIEKLRSAYGLSVLFISHDLSVVRQICDRVAVMYLGEIVEIAPTEALFETPYHPYTEALISSIPPPEPGAGLPADLDGDVPDPADPPSGCRFHLRCPRVIPPDGTGLNSDGTRGIATLRHALETDEDEVRTADPTELRKAYDLPSELDDETETTLVAAVEAAADGDRETAIEHLAAVEGVCERSNPELQPIAGRRQAACHHHTRGGGWTPE